MNFNKLRLKWKVFAFLLAFCALLLIILWLFQTVLLDAFYKNIRVMEIKRAAAVVMNNAGNKEISGVISDISESSDINIMVTDMDGESLLWAFPAQDRRIAGMNAALILRAQENGGEFYEYSSMPAANPPPGPFPGNRSPAQSLVYVKLSDEAGGIAVIVNAIISPVNATVATLRYQLYFISGIMLLLAVTLAIIIAKRVSKPIEDLNRGAAILAKGDYNTRFSGKGFYEIAELTGTLNTAAEELGKVERLRRELLANVSHDLRTPLSLIYSYAEMMNDFPDEITPEQIKVVMDETQRLSTLVNDVLDISKLEADMERLNISRFNFTKNILETTRRVEELLKSEGYQVFFDAKEDIWLDADETKINRAYYNLLVNAINYSGDNKTISVKQTVREDHVRIDVTDSGEGIPEADLPFIWDRYYKSGERHKRGITGTGLGLSIVKKTVELHGGRYGASSEIGKGSTFWFEIRRP
ncbi:MAG: HAMP domain-containing histidine kinase [Oscillospiraceae bacterium]|jgi:signal transduction histidine kinase|nr:HAMP domain-containing histidine kinase [Oscillospiraceae bacterium]